jgi:hypothetical protein
MTDLKVIDGKPGTKRVVPLSPAVESLVAEKLWAFLAEQQRELLDRQIELLSAEQANGRKKAPVLKLVPRKTPV